MSRSLIGTGISRILTDVYAECGRAQGKFGRQLELQDGHPHDGLEAWNAGDARQACQHAFRKGNGSWSLILVEEVAEALEETERDPVALRAELIQVAAVAVRWIDALDKREDSHG